MEKDMQKLTENQINYIIDNCFENLDYKKLYGWREIAENLITNGYVITTGSECIWIGGVGNFIKVINRKYFLDCCEYRFNLDEFLKSDYFKEIHIQFLKQEKLRIQNEINKLNEITDLI